MEWLKERAMEPSTWRGLGGVVVTLGLATQGSVDSVVALGLSLLSVVEMVRKDVKR